MRQLTYLAITVCIGIAPAARQVYAIDVVGGQTSVVLDTATLSAAASLTLSGVSPDVIAPGTLPGSVAFAITPRSAAVLPTTFAYDLTFPAAGSFSGTIEHQGSVFFNADAVEVGDFTIGFDGARTGTLGGLASGFFVASNAGIAATLFDLAVTSASVQPTSLAVGADLLVSPEFGAFLLANGLSTANLQGAVVGAALVEAVGVPEPMSGVMAAVGVMAALAISRRR